MERNTTWLVAHSKALLIQVLSIEFVWGVSLQIMLSSSIQTTDIKYELVQNMDRGYLRVIDSVDPVVEGDSPRTIPEAVTLLV